MKHYSLVIEEKLVKAIDALINEHGLFSSRSDFIRDAIRARLLEIKKIVLEDARGIEDDCDAEEPAGAAQNFLRGAVADSGHKFRGVH